MSASSSMSLSSSQTPDDASSMADFWGLVNGTRIVYTAISGKEWRAAIKGSRYNSQRVGAQAEYEVWEVGLSCANTIWIFQDTVVNVLDDSI